MEEKIIIKYGNEDEKKKKSRDRLKKYKEFYGCNEDVDCRYIFCGYQFVNEDGEGKCLLNSADINEMGICDNCIIPLNVEKSTKKAKMDFLKRDVISYQEDLEIMKKNNNI